MADYFTHFSCALDLPDTALATAAAELHEAFDDRLRNDEGRTAGFALTAQPADNPTQIWIHDDDGQGLPDDVIAFVAELGPALRLTGFWGFEWAHTCSKPRLDAFGGGACIIDLATGETQDTISTNEWLTRTLADPLNSVEG